VAAMPEPLIVIDFQRGFEDPVWGRRNNPACERNVGRLVEAWRERGEPIVVVRHDSGPNDAGSPLTPGQPGNDLKPEVSLDDAAVLVTKQVNSAFYGDPDLHGWLQEHGAERLVVCGLTTDHCCETTVRMAGNLGYDVRFVLDATATFDRVGPDGVLVTAEDIVRVSAASVHDEFCQVVSTDSVLANS
jgi:nicotinamidase-related amidase